MPFRTDVDKRRSHEDQEKIHRNLTLNDIQEQPTLDEMLDCYDFVDEYCQKYNIKTIDHQSKELSDNSGNRITNSTAHETEQSTCQEQYNQFQTAYSDQLNFEFREQAKPRKRHLKK